MGEGSVEGCLGWPHLRDERPQEGLEARQGRKHLCEGSRKGRGLCLRDRVRGEGLRVKDHDGVKALWMRWRKGHIFMEGLLLDNFHTLREHILVSLDGHLRLSWIRQEQIYFREQ